MPSLLAYIFFLLLFSRLLNVVRGILEIVSLTAVKQTPCGDEYLTLRRFGFQKLNSHVLVYCKHGPGSNTYADNCHYTPRSASSVVTVVMLSAQGCKTI